jgi:hypothetical protein
MHDEFVQRADSLEKWAKTAKDNPVLDVLREATDLKKLNSSYMKSTLIDDLMTDSYAQLYAQIAADLPIKAASPVKTDIKPEPVNGEGTSADGQPIESAAKGRIKGVGRRELLKRAELAGFTTNNQPMVLTERRQSIKDRDGQASEISGHRRSVSVAVPTPRRTDSIAVEVDDDDSSDLSDLSADEIEEMGDQLPPSIKDALGVGRKNEAEADEEEEEADEEEGEGEEGEGEEGEEGEGEEEEEDHEEGEGLDAENEGDLEEEEDEGEEHYDEEHGEEEEEEGEEEEEEGEEEELGEDEGDEEENAENSEMAEDADDEGNVEDDRSAMDIDENALVQEQMRQESGS